MEKVVNRIDSEDLIIQVQNYPAIYQSDTACDKKAIQEAWSEILGALTPDFEEKSPEQKAELRRLICRKWKSIRDSYIRSVAAGKNYKFGELLQFLKKTADMNSDLESQPAKRTRKDDNFQDPDRMFMLSMMDEIKKVPESKRLQLKEKILYMLLNAQQEEAQTQGGGGGGGLLNNNTQQTGQSQRGPYQPITPSPLQPIQVNISVTLQYGHSS